MIRQERIRLRLLSDYPGLGKSIIAALPCLPVHETRMSKSQIITAQRRWRTFGATVRTSGPYRTVPSSGRASPKRAAVSLRKSSVSDITSIRWRKGGSTQLNDQQRGVSSKNKVPIFGGGIGFVWIPSCCQTNVPNRRPARRAVWSTLGAAPAVELIVSPSERNLPRPVVLCLTLSLSCLSAHSMLHVRPQR